LDVHVASDFGGNAFFRRARKHPHWLDAVLRMELPQALQGEVESMHRQFQAVGVASKVKAGKHTANAVAFLETHTRLGVQSTYALFNPKSQEYNQNLVYLTKALRAGNRMALEMAMGQSSGAPVDVLLKLPEVIRSKLSPVYAVQSEQGAKVFYTVANAPRYYMAVSTKGGRNGVIHNVFFGDLVPKSIQ
jgi:hypothetical protein